MPFAMLTPGFLLILAATPAQDGQELLKQGMVQLQQKEPQKARATFEEALAAFQAKGDRHGQGMALGRIGNALMAMGDRRAARESFSKAAATFRELRDNRFQAVMLMNKATTSVELGEREQAVPDFEEAITLARQAKYSQMETFAMLRLGQCFLDLEQIRKGLQPTEVLVDYDAKPRDHAREAKILLSLGLHWRKAGEPRKALEAIKQAASSFHAAGDPGGEGAMQALIGNTLDLLGEKSKALEPFEKALPLLEKAGDRKGIAAVQQILTARYAETGNTDMALKLAHQGIEDARKAKDAAKEANYRGTLGIIQDMMGQTAEGLASCEEALRYFHEARDTRREAWMLQALGSMYYRFQDPEKAGRYYLAALKLHRQNKDRLGEAGILERLGNFLAAGNHPDAEARLTEALTLYRSASDQFGEVGVLQSLGALFQRRGELAKALTYYENAMLLTGTLGSRRVEANTLQSLGALHSQLGNLQKALGFTHRGLELYRTTRDPQGQVDSLLLEAFILPRLDRAGECPPLFQEGARLQSQIREAAFPAMSERQKLSYLEAFETLQHAYLALVASRFAADPAIVRPCFDAWIGFKGNILEAQGRIHGAVLASQDPKVKELRTSLQEARQTRARLFQAQSGDPETERRLREAQARVEALEVALGQVSQAFSLDREANRLDSSALAKQLPSGTAFLDFARINWRDFERGEWNGYRYVAFLFRPEAGGQIRLLDLGPAPAVDQTLADFREQIQATKPVDESLDRLHQLLIKPLEPFLGGVRQLRVCPDGPLHMLPFELLAPRGGRSLMDRFELSYLSSAMDLPRFRTPATPSRVVAILADPDFDLTGGTLRGATRSSRDLQGLRFAPLPETRKEAETIRSLFTAANVLCLMGKEATEGRLQALQAPRILHLATHGYFLGQQALNAPGADRGLKVVGLEAMPDPRLENPMLRSGIALSGANLSIQRGEDEGLVCAEKVLGMNLFGTDLVVLSACNTGVGSVADGQGVFGLKRAFSLAGARTLVVSLWPVPDEETRELMEAFYRNLAKGIPKVQALQEAKRAVAGRKPHPINWAAFVLVGNPE